MWFIAKPYHNKVSDPCTIAVTYMVPRLQKVKNYERNGRSVWFCLAARHVYY